MGISVELLRLDYPVGGLVLCAHLESILADLVCSDAKPDRPDSGDSSYAVWHAAFYAFESCGILGFTCVDGDELGYYIGLAGARFRQSFKRLKGDDAFLALRKSRAKHFVRSELILSQQIFPDQPAKCGSQQRCEPEQPELRRRGSFGKERCARRAGRIDRGVGHRDRHKVDER